MNQKYGSAYLNNNNDDNDINSARAQVSKDKVEYSKQELLADSDDSDSVLNSARKNNNDQERNQIDDEFKKIFGTNYDISKKVKKSISSSSSSSNNSV